MSNEKIAKRYAVALSDLVKDQLNSGLISQNFEFVSAVVSGNNELKKLLKSPIVRKEKKKKILEEIFISKIENTSMQYLIGIVENERAEMIEEILHSFSVLQDERNNILRVEIKTATEISKEQESAIILKLEKITNKKIKSSFKIDIALKGGFLAKIGDEVLDSSISYKLEKLRKNFLSAEISRN